MKPRENNVGLLRKKLLSLAASAPASPSQDLLRDAFRFALTPMVITDTDGFICFVNAAFEQATGHSASELVGNRPNLMRSDLQSPDFYRLMWEQLHREGRWQGEIWNRTKSGQVFREWLSICALPDATGKTTHYLGTYSGLSSPQLALSQGEDVGGIDGVTGALNRRAFLTATDRLHLAHSTVAMIALDICHFTELNEHFGLRVGDTILRQVAMRCLQHITAFGGHSVLGRVGSDEFALAWVPDPAHALSVSDQILRAAETVRQAVCGLYEIDAARTLSVSASIGVSLMTSEEHQAADALLHAAAARQTAAQRAGEVGHYDQLESQRRLVRALREDLLAGRIEVAYQPKVDLLSGKLTGLEALARWTGPDGTPVPASVFIGLAERNGLIADLGDRVLESVLRQLADWRSQNLSVVPVAVNFSAPQFQRSDTAERLQSALERHAIPPEWIEIELTESILLNDFETAIQTLHRLRDVGVRLSIDDFGTGYSSLAYLRRFRVDALKLDRSFVTDVETDTRTREIIETVIALAHKFDMSCVAEGIETVGQHQTLLQMGCDHGQGYLFARPLSAHDLCERFFSGDPFAFKQAPSPPRA